MRLPKGSRQKKRGRLGIGSWSIVSTPASSSFRRQPGRSVDLEAQVPLRGGVRRNRVGEEVKLDLVRPRLEPHQLLVGERGRHVLFDEAEDAPVERSNLVLPPAPIRRRDVLEAPDPGCHAAQSTPLTLFLHPVTFALQNRSCSFKSDHRARTRWRDSRERTDGGCRRIGRALASGHPHAGRARRSRRRRARARLRRRLGRLQGRTATRAPS